MEPAQTKGGSYWRFISRSRIGAQCSEFWNQSIKVCLSPCFVAMEAELWTSLADALGAVWPTALHAWYLAVNIFGNARQGGAARFNSEVER